MCWTMKRKGTLSFATALYDDCGAQIVFATVDTIGNETMEDYRLALINEWEVGDARKQNGFVVVLAIDDDDYGGMPGTGLDLELSGASSTNWRMSIWNRLCRLGLRCGRTQFFDALFERIADICGADVTLADGDARFEAWLNTEDGAEEYEERRAQQETYAPPAAAWEEVARCWG